MIEKTLILREPHLSACGLERVAWLVQNLHRSTDTTGRGVYVRSSRGASEPFFLTEVIPLSRASVVV